MTSRNTTQLVYVPDHRDRALATLPSRYRGKPRVEALVKAFAVGVQAFEDDAFDLLVSTHFGGASGKTLDLWGKLVGQQRLGLTDAEYRNMIAVRIFANNCHSTLDDVIFILQQTTAPSTVEHATMYPAGAQFWVQRTTLMSDAHRRAVARILRDVTVGAVSFHATEWLSGDLGHDGDDTAEGYDSGPLARRIL